jgi:hypothetical protein
MVHSTWRAPAMHGGEAVGHRKAQVVVAMHRPDHLVGIGNPFAQLVNALRILFGNVVANRVRNVDGGRTFLDHRFDDPAQEIELRAAGVFAGKLDVGDSVARKAHSVPGRDENVLGRHAQLLLHVDRAGCNERMDAPGLRRLDRFQRPRDVLVEGAAQARHGRILDGFGYSLDCLEVAVGRCRKARFNDIHAHAFKLTSNPQLFLLGHGSTGTLFTVTQGGIENDQMFLGHGYLLENEVSVEANAGFYRCLA